MEKKLYVLRVVSLVELKGKPFDAYPKEKEHQPFCDSRIFCLLSCTFVVQIKARKTCNVESSTLQKKKILKGPLSNR